MTGVQTCALPIWVIEGKRQVHEESEERRHQPESERRERDAHGRRGTPRTVIVRGDIGHVYSTKAIEPCIGTVPLVIGDEAQGRRLIQLP